MKLFAKTTAVLTAATLLPAQIALADQNFPYANPVGTYEHMGGYGMGWGGWFFGPLMMLLVLGALVGGVVLILRLLGVGGGAANAGGNALNLLNDRFARGDIDEDEYRKRRDALNS